MRFFQNFRQNGRFETMGGKKDRSSKKSALGLKKISINPDGVERKETTCQIGKVFREEAIRNCDRREYIIGWRLRRKMTGANSGREIGVFRARKYLPVEERMSDLFS